MRWLQAGAQFLQAEARIVARSLLDRWFLAALGLFAALLILAAQLQFHSTISVGLEEGYGSDRPLLAGFHDPEISEFGQIRFRWTTERSLIRLPGVGGRSLLLTIQLLAVDQSLAAQAPSSIEIWSNGALLATVPIRPEAGETLSVLVPADTSIRADQTVELRSATFTPAGDRRAISLPITQITATSEGALAWPAWPALISWLGAATLLWLALCRIELPRTTALALLLAATALARDRKSVV